MGEWVERERWGRAGWMGEWDEEEKKVQGWMEGGVG